jgi:excisionase family DNA binding protein
MPQQVAVVSPTWLRVTQAAEYSGLSVDTIYTACERGELRHVRVGGRRAIRLRAEWIDSWLEQHTRAAPALRGSLTS